MAEIELIPINISPAEIISNVTSNLPPEIAASINVLLTIFKAVGIVIIVYLIFLIISIIFNIKRYKLIKKTWGKVQEIEQKIDRILPKHKGKQKEEK